MLFTILIKDSENELTNKLLSRHPKPRDLGSYYLFTGQVTLDEYERVEIYAANNGEPLTPPELIMQVGYLMATEYAGAIEISKQQGHQLQDSPEWEIFINGTDEERAALLTQLESVNS